MAGTAQRVVWTALPGGYTPDREALRVNLHVSPRLTLSTGDDRPELSLFPAWLAWPNVIGAAEIASGWSLAAPQPGRVVMPDDTVGEAEGAAPPGLPLETHHDVRRGSLPSLRFGRRYRVRVRSVDLAGAGEPWTPRDVVSGDLVAGPLRYGRFEPVETPPLALVRGDPDPGEGESMPRAALRSRDDASRNSVRARRHVFPARVGHRFAEQHGVMDGLSGKIDPNLFGLLSLKDGELATLIIESEGFAPDPAALEKPVPVRTAYAVMPENFDLPYLPDPLAAGAGLQVFGADGVDPKILHKIPFYDDIWDFDAAPDWPKARPFIIVAVESGPGDAKWDPARREFIVPLRKAERARIRMSALLSRSGVETMKLVELIRSGPDGLARWSRVEPLVVDGRHWMVTPWRTVELVHAVQRPLVTPAPSEISVKRDPGALEAKLAFQTPLHAKSTHRIDVDGRWREIVDDPSKPGPEIRNCSGHAFDQRLFRLDTPQQMYSAHGGHHFADTRYRKVHYRVEATTRFREYMPKNIRESPQGSALKVTSGEVRTWIGSSAPPPPPKLVYVIPTFGWNRNVQGGEQRSWRRGGGLRVYLDRPWFASGFNQMLAVVLPRAGIHLPQAMLKEFVTQWGADPAWKGGPIRSIAPTLADFPLRVQRAPIPYAVPGLDVGDETLELDLDVLLSDAGTWHAAVTLAHAKRPATFRQRPEKARRSPSPESGECTEVAWRTDDAYDRDERERRRALPLRDRYECRLIAIIVAALAVGVGVALAVRAGVPAVALF